MSDRSSSPSDQQDLFPSASVSSPTSEETDTLARLVTDFASEVAAGTCPANVAALESRINDAAFLGKLSAFRPRQPYIRSLVREIKAAAKPPKRALACALATGDRK